MKKMTALALVAALGVAAPAFAQTPADIKNFRDGSAIAAPETPAAPVTMSSDATAKKSAKHSTKKSAKHSTKKSSHSSKSAEKEAKTEKKEETTTEKK